MYLIIAIMCLLVLGIFSIIRPWCARPAQEKDRAKSTPHPSKAATPKPATSAPAEADRLKYGIQIPAEAQTQTPGMWIEKITLRLFQCYSSTSISLILDEGNYKMVWYKNSYTSSNSNLKSMVLSPREAVWVESEVRAALGSQDTELWSSMVGGDVMLVRIQTKLYPEVYIKGSKPYMKYYDLMSSLTNLAYYGSHD